MRRSHSPAQGSLGVRGDRERTVLCERAGHCARRGSGRRVPSVTGVHFAGGSVAGTDSTEARVAAAVALTAALFSPRMRGMLRSGAVRGLAGVLTAGDAMASFARGVSRGVREPAARPADPSPGPSTPPAGMDGSAPVASATPAAAETAGGGATAMAAATPRARKRRSPKARATPAAAADAAPETSAPAADPAEGARE